MKHTSFCSNKSFTRAAKLAQEIGCAAFELFVHVEISGGSFSVGNTATSALL